MMGLTHWINLPEELQQLVMARFPLTSIVRLRVVSKQWKKILLSRELDCLRREVMIRSCRPWFVFLSASGRTPWKNSRCACFDPDEHKWRRLPLHLGGTNKIGVFLASLGNILCLMGNMHLNDDSDFWICNPFSGKKRMLSPPPSCFCLGPPDPFQAPSDGDPPALFQALIVDKTTNCFKFFVEGYYKTVDVYDCSTNSWTPTRMNLPSHIEFSITRPVCKGVLYCIARSPSRVVAYNIQENLWIDPVALISASVHKAHLIEYQNEVLMIGAIKSTRIERDQDWTYLKICIWKLNILDNSWEEIIVMPPALQEEFIKRNNCDNLYFVGQSDLVYLTSVPTASDKKINEPLFYSFSQKSWYWTPICSSDLRYSCSGSIVSPIWRSFYSMPNMYACEPSPLEVSF